MAMTYSILVGAKTTSGSIRHWVNNSAVDAETVLLEAQAHIYTLLRVQEMLTSTSAFSVSAGDSEKAVPTGCLAVRAMHASRGEPVVRA